MQMALTVVTLLTVAVIVLARYAYELRRDAMNYSKALINSRRETNSWRKAYEFWFKEARTLGYYATQAKDLRLAHISNTVHLMHEARKFKMHGWEENARELHNMLRVLLFAEYEFPIIGQLIFDLRKEDVPDDATPRLKVKA